MKNLRIFKNLEINFFVLISSYFALLIKDQLTAENSIFSVFILYTFIFTIFTLQLIFLIYLEKLLNQFFFKHVTFVALTNYEFFYSIKRVHFHYMPNYRFITNFN